MENTNSLRQIAAGGAAEASIAAGNTVEAQTGIDVILKELFSSLQRDSGFAAGAILKLRKLKTLVDEGLITQEEYEAKKKEWLSDL